MKYRTLQMSERFTFLVELRAARCLPSVRFFSFSFNVSVLEIFSVLVFAISFSLIFRFCNFCFTY